jgi:hypothetical protein
MLGSTLFAHQDLTTVQKLETIKHNNPSRVDFETVTLPRMNPVLTPFLHGIGCSNYLIEALQDTILPPQPIAVNVFISFAPSDQQFYQSLKNHLSFLMHPGIIHITQEAILAPDTQQETPPNTAFKEARLVIVLISAEFLASHHAWKTILDPTVHLIPILLRRTKWLDSPLGRLQPLPMNGTPIKEWEDEDVALTDVAESIGTIVRPLHEQLTIQEAKRRERDLLVAKLIRTRTETAEKRTQAEDQKPLLQKAEMAYRDAQRQRETLSHRQEKLQAEISLLETTQHSLYEQIHTLKEE